MMRRGMAMAAGLILVGMMLLTACGGWGGDPQASVHATETHGANEFHAQLTAINETGR